MPSICDVITLVNTPPERNCFTSGQLAVYAVGADRTNGSIGFAAPALPEAGMDSKQARL
jgi:hypothetical protein